MMKSNNCHDRLITPAAVAALLSMNTQTLAVWRHLGKGPVYIKVEGAVRYRLSDIESWLRHNTITPAEHNQRQW